MERVAWMVPFARRARTIRMCSLDARGLGPIQATLLKTSNKLLRPCLGQGASRRAKVGRVRSLAILSILRGCFALVQDGQVIEVLLYRNGFRTVLVLA
jgi:hypothetical protein